MQQHHRGKSFRTRLIKTFILVALLPIALVSIASGINSTQILRNGIEELTLADLDNMQTSLHDWMASYQDILYQIYTDEEIIAMVEKLDVSEDLAVTRNQLRRELRGLLNTKEHIKSITILSDGGQVVFYDSLVPSNQENSWMKYMDLSQQELYDTISQDNALHYFPTSPAGEFAGKENYLFHMARRIIHYQDVNKEYGVVILSIDEAMLSQLCGSENWDGSLLDSFTFLVDETGHILSYPDKQYLTTVLDTAGKSLEEREKVYQQFALESTLLQPDYVSIHVRYDRLLQCDLVQVINRSQLEARLMHQQQFMTVILLVALLLMLVTLLLSSSNLSASITRIVGVMEQVQQGDLAARVAVDHRMPLEISRIGTQYNQAMDQCVEAMEKERQASEKLRNAEILALESQINPHFIYNTLDTINWMAIEDENYEISDAIGAFASILRYSCMDSNAIVPLREELAWLNQYIVLQQLRMKHPLQCVVDAPEELLECRIHKLLLQPFVENSVLHGFKDSPRPPQLNLSIRRQSGCIYINIRDNGVGMSEQMVEAMNRGIFPPSHSKRHIGIENVLTRIRLYYGKKAMISVNSGENLGTEIIISLPEEEVLPQ